MSVARTIGMAGAVAAMAAAVALGGASWAWIAVVAAAAAWALHVLRGWDPAWALVPLGAAAVGAQSSPLALAALGLAFMARVWRTGASWRGLPAVAGALAAALALPAAVAWLAGGGRLPASIERADPAFPATLALAAAVVATAVCLVRFKVRQDKEWLEIGGDDAG